LKVEDLIKEMEDERSIRINEIRDAHVGSAEWFYLEGAITTLANLLYFYLVKKGE